MGFEDLEHQHVRSKWEQLTELTKCAGRARSDFGALMPFFVSLGDLAEQLSDVIDDEKLYRDTVDFLDRRFTPVHAAVELFWQTYRPVQIQPETFAPGKLDADRLPAESLSPEHERLILYLLEHLQLQNEVPYEPDADDLQWIEDIQIYLHIVAARAFRIMRNERGLSEAAVDCLENADRAIERIRSTKRAAGDYDIGLLDNTVVDRSTNAVSALVLAERCRIQKSAGNYESALHYLARADLLLYLADGNVQVPSQMEERLRQPIMPRSEAFGLFEAIQSNKLVVQDWQQVTRDCTELLEGWEIGDDASVSEWIAFWREARSWASAQLSPSEYRKMRAADQREAAEHRLRNYFFGDGWANLPDRAQERLRSADETWNSSQRMASEAILNDLLRATEEMCYEFIWKPLSESRESSLEFLKFEAKATGGHSTPSSRHYVDLCKQSFLHDHLRRQQLTDKEFNFLSVILPNLLGQLIDRRNPAEHETGSTMSNDVIADCFKRFLGIGMEGVLPEFARIGRKLRSGRRRRR